MEDINYKKKLQKDLYTINDQIKLCKSEKKYVKLCTIASQLIDVILDTNIDVDIPRELEYEMLKKDTFRTSKKDLNHKIDSFYKEYDLNKKMCKIYPQINKYYYPWSNEKRFISSYETYKLAKNFFKEYDEKISDYFNKIIEDKKIAFSKSLQDDDYDGYTTCGFGNITSYINIKENDNLNDVIALVHETIHSFVSTKNNNDLMDNSLNMTKFIEVYPSFIEIICADYLNKIPSLQKDSNSIQKSYDRAIIEGLLLLSEFLDKFINSQDKEKFILYNYDFYENIYRYLYGKIIAYKFYEQYKCNPNAAKNNILEFSVDSLRGVDNSSLLNSHGLTEDSIKSAKSLKRVLKNHLDEK